MAGKLGRVAAAGWAGLSAAFAALGLEMTAFWQLIKAVSNPRNEDGVGWLVALSFPIWGLAFLGIAGTAAFFASRAAYRLPIASIPWSVAGLGIIVWFIPAFEYVWHACSIPYSPFEVPSASRQFWCWTSGPDAASVIGPFVSIACLCIIALGRYRRFVLAQSNREILTDRKE
jgi:hypothetical protein